MKKLTDEEFVEKIRKNVLWQRRWGKWISAFHLFVSIAFFVIGIIGVRLCLLIFNNNLFNNQQKNIVFLAVSMGFFMGIFLGTLFLKAGHAFVQGIAFLRIDRTSELLIKHYDSRHLAESSMDRNVGLSSNNVKKENTITKNAELVIQEKNDERFRIDE